MDGGENRPEILLASPRGFCAGVERAIAIVEGALERFGAPVYVKHAIVHNRHVVEGLEAKGAIFVEDLDQVPVGSLVIFSAHGVSPVVREKAAEREFEVLDATCPLVTKVHAEARRFAGEQRTVFLIGHREHVEVKGTLGEAPDRIVVIGDAEEARRVTVPDPGRVAYLTQTTLSLDDSKVITDLLKQRFPALVWPAKNDICYATQNRQNAVQALVEEADVIIVVGSANSSNSKRLTEVAKAGGVRAYLVESYQDLKEQWLEKARCIGITAGASAPEEIVQELVIALSQRYDAAVREIEIEKEEVVFPLPARLTR